MKKFWTLLKYEIYKLIVSPTTYVVFLIFTASIGAIFLFLLHEYAKFEQDVPFAQMFFRCFWLPTCSTIPLITMRSFSEEYKNGMFQNLFSIQISHTEVILTKFLSAYLMFMALWLSSLIGFAIIGSGQWSIFYETAFVSDFNIAGGLAFISVVGLFFVAIGMLASSLTENQIIASMTTFFILMTVFIGGQFLADCGNLSNFSVLTSYKESLNVFWQLDNFCCGIIDSRIVVFNITSCMLALCLSYIAVRNKLN